MLSDEEILSTVEAERDPQGLCRKLVDTANERGGVDNITVVVVLVPEPASPKGKVPSPK
jgi:serine/threonine protein phosphatase PrpC